MLSPMKLVLTALAFSTIGSAAPAEDPAAAHELEARKNGKPGCMGGGYFKCINLMNWSCGPRCVNPIRRQATCMRSCFDQNEKSCRRNCSKKG